MADRSPSPRQPLRTVTPYFSVPKPLVWPKLVALRPKFPLAAYLYEELVQATDWETGKCDPQRTTQSLLARRLLTSQPAISRVMKALEAAGVIRVARDPGWPNEYELPHQWELAEPGHNLPLPDPRSETSLRAECVRLSVRFLEEYVAQGRRQPGVDREAWATARAMARAGDTPAQIEAYLASNLAMQRGDAISAAAARRRAS